MNQHPAHIAALECASEFADEHQGPHAPGTRVLDTVHGDHAYVVAQTPDWAVVVYEDSPETSVSCGNEPSRWKTA